VFTEDPLFKVFNDLEHTIYTSPLKPLSIKGFNIFLQINEEGSFQMMLLAWLIALILSFQS
jgi:hypothetical protein